MDVREPVLFFDAVSKSFGETAVLDRFSHVFIRNSLTFIEGPSGSGKTTILRLACGLETPDGGTVVHRQSLRFSYVFQEDRLCENLSAVANVRLVCADRAAGLPAELLGGLGIGNRANTAVRSLSGGEKRRVALARALAAPADVLLLDEPMTGLDEASREQVLAFMKPYLVDKTVLWVTHDRDEYRAFQSYDVVRIGEGA